jgi:hypothetical protein
MLVVGVVGCATQTRDYDESSFGFGPSGSGVSGGGAGGGATSSVGAGGVSSGTGTPGAVGSGGTAASAGGASTSSGGASASSTGGAAGSGGTGGVGGVTATAGGASSGGSGGSSGSSGSGGTGNTGPLGPVDEPGACAEDSTFRVQYLRAGSAAEIRFDLHFFNDGASPIPLNELVFRYYFTDEETAPWTKSIYDANLSNPGYLQLTSSVRREIYELDPPLENADSFLELHIASTTALAGQEGSMQVALQPGNYNPPDQDHSNDYSYKEDNSALEDWDRIVVYRNDELIFGCVPEAL